MDPANDPQTDTMVKQRFAELVGSSRESGACHLHSALSELAHSRRLSAQDHYAHGLQACCSFSGDKVVVRARVADALTEPLQPTGQVALPAKRDSHAEERFAAHFGADSWCQH
jgi:hypothetical protein